VKNIIIDAMRKAERSYLQMASESRRENENASDKFLKEADDLTKLRRRMEAVKDPSLTYRDIDDLGKWIDRNLWEHVYSGTYSNKDNPNITDTFDDITFGGKQPFLSGSFTMRIPQFGVEMKAMAKSHPFFKPDLARIGRLYNASKPDVTGNSRHFDRRENGVHR